jgi:hypothetical protein
MSTTPNAYGNFLGNPSPFLSNYAGIGSTWGTFIKPGGRVAAYVRSTGAQDGEDHFAASGLLVASINEGLKRCRSGFNDIVLVLPGHTETYSTSGAVWANLVAGAQIIGCGSPGSSNNPTITLSHVGASLALNVANVTIAGLNIQSATAAVTGAIVVTAAGVTLASNFIKCTGAFGANVPVQVTGAGGFQMLSNYVSVDSTAAIVNVTLAASADMLIIGNLFLQVQGTSGGVSVAIADVTGITGFVANNYTKTFSAQTAPAGGVTLAGITNSKVGIFENYALDNAAGSGFLGPATAT